MNEEVQNVETVESDHVGAMAPDQAQAAAENAEASAGIEPAQAEVETCRVRVEREFWHIEHQVVRRVGEILFLPIEEARKLVSHGLALILDEKVTVPPAV